MRPQSLLGPLCALALCLLPLSAPAQGRIGVVASLEPSLTGQAPGAARRGLSIGSDVVADDTIVSSAAGRAQLLFEDQTTLSVAPNSQIVLDRFVYDPDRRRGEIGIRMTRGALRFIGGLATRRSEGEIVTPTATVGIRGSTALVQVRNGRTLAVFLSGKKLCLRAAGGEACTNRRGGVLDETGYLGKISDASLAALLREIDGTPPAVFARRSGSTGTAGDPEAGPFGSDGSVRDRAILDDRLGTDTEFGMSIGEAPVMEETPEEQVMPEIVCIFDGEEEYCYEI